MIRMNQTFKSLVRLIQALPRQRKKALAGLIPVAIVAGLSDVLVVAAVSRLFTVVVGSENRPPLPFTELVPTDSRFKVIGLVIVFVGLSWFSSFSKLFLRTWQMRLKSAIWRDLSEMAQRKILGQKYEYFLGKNKTDLSATLLVNVDRVAENLVLPILQLTSGLFVIGFLFIAVLVVEKVIAIILIGSMLLCYIFITLTITPFIRFAARQRITLVKQANNILNDSLRTILDVQLTGSEPFFEKKYSKAWKTTIPYIWKGEALPETPRALIEPLGITMIFAIGLFPLFKNPDSTNLVEIVPFLATIAVTSLKLTPPLQDSFRAFTLIRSSIPDLEETLKLIDLPINRLTLRSPGVPSPKGIFPRYNIKLNHISYKYPNSDQLVLKDINLTIPIGGRIAFVGATGSGKTTTANQLLCLLRPTNGSLQLDGIDVSDDDIPAWQANCAYVPQSITLLNNNVLENVAYGQDPNQIDSDKVWEALQAAQLADLVAELPLGLLTTIGENGIRLSGGQRQRLALARAFYRNAKLLVLDEATSALDNRTEAEVMDAIEVIGRRCTLIVIAHRLSTVMRSDCIYEFEKGNIKASGTFEQLRKRSDTFNDLAYFEKSEEEESDI